MCTKKRIAETATLWLVAGLVVVVLTGCAHMAAALVGASPPNRYAPAGNRGGWSQTRVAPDRFLVFFMGTWSGEERVTDLAMLRAAELAIEHGFSHFEVLTKEVYMEGSDSGTGHFGSSESDRLTASMLVRMRRDAPGNVETARDAQAVFDDVTAKYDIYHPDRAGRGVNRSRSERGAFHPVGSVGPPSLPTLKETVL